MSRSHVTQVWPRLPIQDRYLATSSFSDAPAYHHDIQLRLAEGLGLISCTYCRHLKSRRQATTWRTRCCDCHGVSSSPLATSLPLPFSLAFWTALLSSPPTLLPPAPADRLAVAICIFCLTLRIGALTSVDEYELDGKGELKEKTFKVSVNPPHVFTRLGERTEI